MLLDDTSNRVGADNVNPGTDRNASGQGASNRAGKTRGGVRDIFNKYSKQYRDAKNDDQQDGLRGYFRDQARKQAFKKGKDFLQNTDTGKKISAKGKELFNKLDSKTGGLAGKLDKAGFKPGMDRDELKQKAKEYLKDDGKKEIKKYLGDRLKGGVKSEVKEGAEKVAKNVAKDVVKEGVEQGVKKGVQVGVDAGVDLAIEGVADTIAAAGFVGGPLGILTEILAQFVVLAISLGINDAIDGVVELAKGHPKEAMHLFIRAVTKIIVFVVFIVSAVVAGSLLPGIGLIFPLIAIDFYWALGSIPFVKDLAVMQGLVWWEKIFIVGLNLFVIEIVLFAVIIALYAYCNPGLVAGTLVAGPVGGKVGSFVDSHTTSADSFCTGLQNLGGSSNFGGGGAGGSFGSVSGDETVGNYTPPGGSCKFSNANLCQGKLEGACTNSATLAKVNGWSSQVDAAVQKYGPIPGVVNTSAFIKAIMTNESGGNPDAESPTHAAGLMQFLVSTANGYGPQCSSSYQASTAWLKSHPEESICMSIKYFQSMAKGDCGKPRVEVRNLAAGYNRGPGYCQTSGRFNACSGQTGCDGTPIKGWECQWKDAAHTQCNEYVYEGDTYAPRVFGCYVKLNGGGK